MQSILWGLELYKGDLLKSRRFFMIQNKGTALLWISRAAGFRWTGISISRGFLKARSPWKMLLWTRRCGKHPLASFLQGRKCSNLFICLFLPFSLLSFSWNQYKVGRNWAVSSVSWPMTNYWKLLLFVISYAHSFDKYVSSMYVRHFARNQAVRI